MSVATDNNPLLAPLHCQQRIFAGVLERENIYMTITVAMTTTPTMSTMIATLFEEAVNTGSSTTCLGIPESVKEC